MQDLHESGHITIGTKVSFGLIAGNIYRNQETEMQKYFDQRGWLFWGPSIIREKIKRLAKNRYENNAVTIAAKILLRE